MDNQSRRMDTTWTNKTSRPTKHEMVWQPRFDMYDLCRVTLQKTWSCGKHVEEGFLLRERETPWLTDWLTEVASYQWEKSCPLFLQLFLHPWVNERIQHSLNMCFNNIQEHLCQAFFVTLMITWKKTKYIAKTYQVPYCLLCQSEVFSANFWNWRQLLIN